MVVRDVGKLLTVKLGDNELHIDVDACQSLSYPISMVPQARFLKGRIKRERY
jgi:hypothetical protein